MRRLVIMIVVLIAGALFIGCTSTLTMDSQTRTRKVSQNMKRDIGLIGEDWDRIWIVNRPCRLTPNTMD